MTSQMPAAIRRGQRVDVTTDDGDAYSAVVTLAVGDTIVVKPLAENFGGAAGAPDPERAVARAVLGHEVALAWPREGDRVRLRRDVERFPHFAAPAGLRGTVNHVEGDPAIRQAWVRMDEQIAGAESWANEIAWSEEHGDTAESIWADLQLLDADAAGADADAEPDPTLTPAEHGQIREDEALAADAAADEADAAGTRVEWWLEWLAEAPEDDRNAAELRAIEDYAKSKHALPDARIPGPGRPHVGWLTFGGVSGLAVRSTRSSSRYARLSKLTWPRLRDRLEIKGRRGRYLPWDDVVVPSMVAAAAQALDREARAAQALGRATGGDADRALLAERRLAASRDALAIALDALDYIGGARPPAHWHGPLPPRGTIDGARALANAKAREAREAAGVPIVERRA